MTQGKFWDGSSWQNLVVGADGHSAVIGANSPIVKGGTAKDVTLSLNQGALVLPESSVSGLTTDLNNTLSIAALAAYRSASTAVMDLPPRLEVTSSATAVGSGNVHLSFFTPSRDFTVTNMTMITPSGAVYTTTTNPVARMGIYDAQTGTLIASTNNDYASGQPATLFSAQGAAYTRALTSQATLTAGNRYAVAVIQVGATTSFLLAVTPGVKNVPVANQTSRLLNLTPRLTATITGQADLPSSYTVANFTTTSAQYIQPFYTRLS